MAAHCPVKQGGKSWQRESGRFSNPQCHTIRDDWVEAQIHCNSFLNKSQL